MSGYCENCAKEQTCHKDIGIIWGFCNTDFEPRKEKKMTAYELAMVTASQNRPFDYGWLRRIFRHYSAENIHDWAVANVEEFAPAGASKQLIGRAANILIEYMRDEIR